MVLGERLWRSTWHLDRAQEVSPASLCPRRVLEDDLKTHISSKIITFEVFPETLDTA